MKERKTKWITELAVKIWNSMVTSNQKHICKNLTQNSKQTSAFLTLTRFPKPRPELSENSMQHYYIKSALSLLRRLTTWRYPHLLPSAGICSTATACVDRYLLPAGRSAKNPPHVAAAVDRGDRQTDRRRTPDRYTHPASRTMRAASRNRTVIV